MATVYWFGGTGNWSDHTNHWSNNSGNSPVSLHGSVPGTDDDVVIDSNSGLSGGSITFNAFPLNCNNFVSNTGFDYTIVTQGKAFHFYGYLTLETGITFSGNFYPHFISTNTGNTITSAGKTFEAMVIEGVGGEWSLSDSLTVSTELQHNNGTFDANNHNVTANSLYFYADTGFNPTVIMGSGIWTPGRSAWVLDEYSGEKVNIIGWQSPFPTFNK